LVKGKEHLGFKVGKGNQNFTKGSTRKVKGRKKFGLNSPVG